MTKKMQETGPAVYRPYPTIKSDVIEKEVLSSQLF